MHPLISRTLLALGAAAAISSAGAQSTGEKPRRPDAARQDMEKHRMGMGQAGAWKEMDAFHALLAATYHPVQGKKDVAPLRLKADSLAAAARTWAASKGPASCATEQVKSSVATIATDALALGNLVLANATDAELTKAITDLHTRFEGVEKQCGGMHMKGMKQ